MSDVADSLRKKARELLDLADEVEARELLSLFRACSKKDQKRFLAMIAAEGYVLPEVKR